MPGPLGVCTKSSSYLSSQMKFPNLQTTGRPIGLGGSARAPELSLIGQGRPEAAHGGGTRPGPRASHGEAGAAAPASRGRAVSPSGTCPGDARVRGRGGAGAASWPLTVFRIQSEKRLAG